MKLRIYDVYEITRLNQIRTFLTNALLIEVDDHRWHKFYVYEFNHISNNFNYL